METFNISTEWGLVSITLTDEGISSLDLPGDAALNMGDGNTEKCGGCDNVASLLKDYFKGRDTDFSKLKVDLSARTPFFRDICRAARLIPYGEIRTYGELAEMAGRKGAARAAGRVMATNSIPVIIPCHRVVSSDGSLTGYSASGGLDTKLRLLKMEGVSFDRKGRVITEGHN